MNSYRYILWVRDIGSLYFDDFWDNFVRDSFENCFKQRFGGNILKLRECVEQEFDMAMDEGCYISDGNFLNRAFANILAEYVATRGISVKTVSTNGPTPQVIIHEEISTKVHQYLTEPETDLDTRSPYKAWLDRVGLLPIPREGTPQWTK